MKSTTILLTFLAVMFSLASAPAQAAAVTNLSSQPQTIEVEVYNGYQKISIEAGHTYRIIGEARVRFRGGEHYIDNYEEYAIWPSGDFGPQRSRHGIGGSSVP